MNHNTDRRETDIPVAQERRTSKGPRRGKVDPTTCEIDYSDEDLDFLEAMDQYKKGQPPPVPDLARSPGSDKVYGLP